jgi:hypothetical protein
MTKIRMARNNLHRSLQTTTPHDFLQKKQIVTAWTIYLAHKQCYSCNLFAKSHWHIIGMQHHASQICLVMLGHILSNENKIHRHVKFSKYVTLHSSRILEV